MADLQLLKLLTAAETRTVGVTESGCLEWIVMVHLLVPDGKKLEHVQCSLSTTYACTYKSIFIYRAYKYAMSIIHYY